MPNLRDIKRKISSVKKTEQITKAMKMVSASKFRRSQEKILATRPYSKKMLEVLKSLALRTSESSHPLLQKREGDITEIVVISADKGLCGGFNNSVINKALELLNKGESDEKRLSLIGKKSRDYFKKRKYSIKNAYVGIFGKLGYEQAARMARDIIKAYTEESIGKVLLVYTEFRSALSYNVVVEQLLPIVPMDEKEAESVVDFIYEPSREEIFNQLLPRFVEVQVYHALLESEASEHAARMAAMDNASKNAKEMIDQLVLKFNKLRQAAITKELLEVVSGAEALKA